MNKSLELIVGRRFLYGQRNLLIAANEAFLLPGRDLPTGSVPNGDISSSKDSKGPFLESHVYLHLKDVREGFLVKYDWVFLNDRILFIRMAGIGTFISKNVLNRYASLLGEERASALIERLREIRRKKASGLSEKDISNILQVDTRNSQILLSQVKSAVFKRRKIQFQCRLVLVTEHKKIRKADISWSDASWKNIALFLKARLGPRLIER